MAQKSPAPAKDFQSMISMEPALGPLTADEQPTAEEMDALDDINSEVIKFIHGDNRNPVMGMISNARELYQGISQAAFQILLATKQKYEAGGQKVPPAALFGEGAAIHTAVDELFQIAQAAQLPGSDDQDQYSAAMMNIMRLAGEHIEKSNDDDSVAEAQELLIDVETAGGMPGAGPATYTEEDNEQLTGAIQRSLDAQNQALYPQQAPDPEAPVGPQQGAPQQSGQAGRGAQMPPQGGGILNV